MAHPYAAHKDHKVSKHRVGKIMKSGGHAHHDEAADKKLFAGLMHEHESKMHHGKSHSRLDRFARGGRTKAKGHVHINIVNAPHGGSPSPMGLTGAAPPPGAMGPPIAPPPGMGGPPFPPPQAGGMGPPMPPGGMPRKSGGRANSKYREGEASKANLKKWAEHASSNSPPKKAFAKGGKVAMKAGSFSGEGRLEKKKAYGLPPKKAG
jgi:hypothetical protein